MKPTKKIHSRTAIVATAFVICLSINSHAALVVWGGADGQYLDPASWVGGIQPSTGTAGNGDTAQINGGNVTYTPGGDLQIRNGATLEINGGSFTQVGGNSWMQFGGGNLIVNGGSFNMGTAGNLIRNASSTLTVTGGVANLSGDLIINPATTGIFNFTGGTINLSGEFKPAATDYTLGSGLTLTTNIVSFSDGPGRLILDDGNFSVNGAAGFSGLYTANGAYVNFTSSSVSTFTFRNFTTGQLTATNYLTNGAIRIDGISNGGAFTVNQVGSDVVIYLNAIPEPTSAFLSLVGVGTLLLRRRRA